MGNEKERRPLLAMNGITIGSAGQALTELIFGTVTACVPVVGASSYASGSMSIAGADVGMSFVFTGQGAVEGVAVYSASVTAAGAVSASYLNPGSADTSASEMTFAYIGFR